MELGKVPPHDIEAEQAVLGSMLTDKEAVFSALELLKEDSFYREDNRAIFAAIVSLYAKSEPIDIITVKAELIENGSFERVGGLEYLASLPERVPTTANVDKYIKIVEEKAMMRNLILTANELISLGYDETEEVDRIMDMAEKRVFELTQKKNAKGYTAIKDVLVETFAKLEELCNQKGQLSGTSTGFADLDLKTSGLHDSDLIIVAARPAMGKSAFAINIATYIGSELAGILGAICATIGVILPSFIIILLVAKFFAKFKENKIVKGCMIGLKASVIGLIASAVISMGITVFAPNGQLIINKDLYVTVAIFIIALICTFKKLHPIIVICLSAILGIVSGIFLI